MDIRNKAFEVMFGGVKEAICFQQTVNSSPVFLTHPFGDVPLDLRYFVLNPFSKIEKRELDNLACRIGVTVEQDACSMGLQKDWFCETLGTSTVGNHSGNKSLHYHIIFTEHVTEEKEKELVSLLKKAFPFADWTLFENKVALCRVPNAVRDNGVLQQIFEITEKKDLDKTLSILRGKTKRIKDIAEKAHKIFLNIAKHGKAEKKTVIEAIQNLLQNGYELLPESLEYKTIVEILGKIKIDALALIEEARLEEKIKEPEISKEYLPEIRKEEKIKKAVLDVLKETPNICDTYKEWIKLVYAFKDADLSYDEVDAIFRNSNGYDEKKNRYIYEKTRKPRTIHFGYAYHVAREKGGKKLEWLLACECKYCGEKIRFENKKPVNLDGTEHDCRSKKSAVCKYCQQEIYWKDKVSYDDPEHKKEHKPTCTQALKEKAAKTTMAMDYLDDKGRVIKGLAALFFYELKKGEIIYANEFFWYWNGKVWEKTEEIFVELSIQNMIGPVLSTNGTIEDIFKQAKRFFWKQNLKFNANPDLICMENGVFNLKTEELMEHKREYYQTVCLPYCYDKIAAFSSWERFLWDLQFDDPKTIERLQEWAGYCLIPVTNLQKCLFLEGSGSNGKSTFLKTISSVLGEANTAHIEPSKIFDKFRALGLQGKLVDICTDIRTNKVLSEEFKALVDGEEITTEVKFKNEVTFKPFCRFLFSANRFIVTKDNSFGFFRRFDVLTFNRKFADEEKDLFLGEKLQKELPGIFNWALAGLKRLIANRWRMTESSDFTKASKKFELESNPVKQFLEEEVQEMDWKYLENNKIDVAEWDKYIKRFSIPCDEFRRHYVQWCLEHGYDAISDVHLGRELSRLGYEKKRVGEERMTIYLGLKLK